MFKKISLLFSFGALGGFINSLVVWGFGISGINHLLGVKIAPTLSPAWLYQRIVWGGIWGILFLLPFLKKNTFKEAFFASLGPTLITFLVVFPMKAKKGYFGLDLGALTPALVVFFNFVWAYTVVFCLKGVKGIDG